MTFSIPYAKADRWEAGRLAYNDVLAMDIVLPRPGTHPNELDFATVHESSAALGRVKVSVVR